MAKNIGRRWNALIISIDNAMNISINCMIRTVDVVRSGWRRLRPVWGLIRGDDGGGIDDGCTARADLYIGGWTNFFIVRVVVVPILI